MKAIIRSLLVGSLMLAMSSAGAAYSLGKEYTQLSGSVKDNPVVAMQRKPGKIVVIEFFNYACPACNMVSSSLREWADSPKNKQVEFRRIPVVFHAGWELFARAYYTAELLGALDKIDKPLFKAIHQDRQMFADKNDFGDFFEKQGVARADFDKTYNSFAVDRAIEQGKMLRQSYKVYAVPTIIVNSEYLTDLGKTRSPKKFVDVLTFLVDKSKQA